MRARPAIRNERMDRQMSNETTATTSDSNDGKGEAVPGDKLLWGAGEIGAEINREEREAFYLLEKKRIPAEKVGRTWVSSRNTLRRFFGEKLEAALATALAAKLEAAPTSELVAPKRTDGSSKRHGRRIGRAS